MALYHFSAQIISRANGQSACAAAAYRSGEKIENEFDGITHDYQQKFNVEHSVVMLPDNAPACFADRKILWNSVEQNEKQMNAQLAREINFALPRELPPEVQRQIALMFIQEQFVDRGMVADVCFHNPPKMNSKKQPVDFYGIPTDEPKQFIYENPHVHIMLPLRPLDVAGNWEPKTQKLYVCEKDGEQKLFSARQLKAEEGWEKIFHYEGVDGKKSWHTKSYAETHPEECAKLINRYPQSEQIVNEKIAEWNSPETLVAWRAAWADAVNVAYEFAGLDEHIDHRSYVAQGLDLIPTVHEGKFITIEEKRWKEEYEINTSQGERAELIHTDVRGLNNAIREHNTEIRMIEEIKKLQNKMQKLLEPVFVHMEHFCNSIAETLEKLRVKIILTSVKLKECVEVKGNADEKIFSNQKYIDELIPVREERLDELRIQVAGLEKKISKTFFYGKKDSLQKKNEQLQAQIALLESNREYAIKAQTEISVLRNTSRRLGMQISSLQLTKEALLQEYHNTECDIPTGGMDEVDSKRIAIRQLVEDAFMSDVSKAAFEKEAEKIDAVLKCPDQKFVELMPLDALQHNTRITW